MPRKKARRIYGTYTTVIDGEDYAIVRLPLGNGKYKKKVKKLSLIGGTSIAARHWAQTQIEIHTKGGVSDPREMTFAKLCDWYGREFIVPPVYQDGKKLEGLRTYKAQKGVLNRLSRHFGQYKLSDLTIDILRRYKRARLKDVSISAVNRDFALARTMLKKAKARKWVSENIFDAEVLIEAALETQRESPLTKRLAYRLLARSRKSKQFLLYYVIHVFMSTGARPSELFPFGGVDPDVPVEPLTWNRLIDANFKEVLLVSYKGRVRKIKRVPTTAKLELDLRRLYLKVQPNPTDLVFPITTFKRSWNTLRISARCPEVWIRDFRHYYNTKILNISTINDVERMLLLGHTQITTNAGYAHLNDDFIIKYRDAVG